MACPTKPPREGARNREVEIVPTATGRPSPSPLSRTASLGEQQLGYVAFSHLLDQHPRGLTVDELAREIHATEDRPTLERAVANLVDACLLQLRGSELTPSPAAVRVDCAH